MICKLCRKRRVKRTACEHRQPHCRTCCQFIQKYVDIGKLKRRTVPMVADVALVMRELGVSQDRAVIILGGQL